MRSQQVSSRTHDVSQLRILVTGGGTSAPIDDVRVITNQSSGRFSSQLTEAWLDRGAMVHHLATPQALTPLHRLAVVDLDDDNLAEQFARLARLAVRYQNLRRRLTLQRLPTGSVTEYASALKDLLIQIDFDLVMLAIAVSDYAPIPITGKASSAEASLKLTCYPTPKLIDSVKSWSPRSKLVGFKLTSGSDEVELILKAEQLASRSRADLVIANDLSNYHDDQHRVLLIRPGMVPVPLNSSESLGEEIVDQVIRWFFS